LTLALVAATSVACGKSGPPLPPLVRIPAPPTELVAARRGDAVDIRFLVPSANTDGSRPANLRSVEVYAYTGPANLTDEQVVKLGSRVGSVDVKAPRDPNATVDPDEPVSDVPAPEGQGLEQGVAASVREVIGPSASTAVHLPGAPGQTPRETPPLPLAGPPETPVTRVYAGVGITTSGRRGPFSRRAPVPLAPPPPAVPAPDVSYDESAVRVAWEAAPAPAILEEAEGETLPARLIGSSQSSVSYNVYERRPSTSDSAEPVETRLTTAPITETRFEDSRVEWGVERCYGVAVARTFGGMTIESRLSPVTCRQLVDTFPPKAPAGLQTIPSEGLISLVWDQNRETDLAGYLVLRGEAPSGVLAPMTPSPIQQASFTDKAPSGVRFVYAVQAVDRAGNVSAESARTEETAR
jgi:hypothetical protein